LLTPILNPREIITTKLLFVQASPRRGDSKSIQIAKTYLSALRANNRDLEVDTIEL
jgi:FMN-dependent NADH-azoreductase